MKKEFKSFEEIGYRTRLVNFCNAEGTKHLDNSFIGIYGNDEDGYVTAYCDSVTGKITEEDIFDEDGSKILIEDLEI